MCVKKVRKLKVESRFGFPLQARGKLICSKPARGIIFQVEGIVMDRVLGIVVMVLIAWVLEKERKSSESR